MSKIKRILGKLGVESNYKIDFDILISCLKVILQYNEGYNLDDLMSRDKNLFSFISNLNQSEKDYIENEIDKSTIPIEECQVLVQKKIPTADRKKLAAFFTTDEGTNLMTFLVEAYITKNKKSELIIADPFLGSARTLTATIKKIGTKNIKKIWGIEPYPLSALVSYAALLDVTKGKRELIKVTCGDTFIEMSKRKLIGEPLEADIILTNPPFTRWKNLDTSYRRKISTIIEEFGYSKYITRKEPSLQILCMFLADKILKRDGLLASVLPASTFYTIYGRGYKKLIKNKYHLLSILQSGSQPSFSIDSGFKEIIIVALKSLNKKELTAFTELNGIDIKELAKKIMENAWNIKEKYNNTYLANINKIPSFLDNNWLSLIGNFELKELLIKLFKKGLNNGLIGYWEEILGKDTLIRGIEMYGPDFFFIRNKFWNIIEDANSHVKIKNKETKEILKIDKEYLIKSLRKPSLYNYKISPEVDTYMLSVPTVELDELPNELVEYIKWGKKNNVAEPAIRKHDRFWYSHVYYQVQSKDPFGNVFITDKVDLLFKNRGVFANYSEKILAASKNFYIIKNIKKKEAILLTSWLNSTIFISILIQFSRKISDTWTRFLINDYLEFPLLNIKNITDEIYQEISENLMNIHNQELVPFWDQIGKKFRYDLDLSIIKVLEIKNPENFLEKLYKSLMEYRHSII